MKWELKEAVYGDMIRIRLGEFYHYGIYASDTEIIQFGPPPVSLIRKDSEIEVCVTDIEGFLCGKFLEVAVPDRKEAKTRRSPEETVSSARDRIGEKGYNILYNNCEHFAYECAFGQKYCSQAERVREMWRSMPFINVYVAHIPFSYKGDKISNKARAKEIDGCKNAEVREEKKSVWKLLEYGLEHSLGIDASKLRRAEKGGWCCAECCISLSHSGDLVAVAVSRKPVGIDVEKIDGRRLSDAAAEKILTATENPVYLSLSGSARNEYLVGKWTQKESLFKRSEEKVFSPSSIDTPEALVRTRRVRSESGDEYFLTVASDTPNIAKFVAVDGKAFFEK